MAPDTDEFTDEAEQILMEVCPVCHKATAPSFMWQVSDTKRMCLVCHHREMEAGRPVVVSGGAKLTRTMSKTSEYTLKIGGMFVAVIALFVGTAMLFYKPHALQPPPPLVHSKASKERKARIAAQASKGLTLLADGKDGGKDTKTANGKPGEKAARSKKGQNVTVGVATGDRKNGPKERMAATVNALISELPKNTKRTEIPKEAQASIANLIEKGKDLLTAASGGPGPAPTGPSLSPKTEVKEKMLAAKDSVLTMAKAILDKKDADATKTAEVLGKLGAISTTMSDVAGKLISAGTEQKGGSGGMGGSSSATTAGVKAKLEGDILEAQGRAGYDAMEVMMKEAAAEAAGAKAGKTVKVTMDPNSKNGVPGTPTDARSMMSLLGSVKNAASAKGIGVPDKVANSAGKPAAANGNPGAKDAGPKLNSTEIKLHDTMIRLNDLSKSLGGAGGAGLKLNDTAIHLHDTTITLNSTALKLHDYAARLNDSAIHLHDTAIQLHDLTIRLNSTAATLHTASAKLRDPELGVHAAALNVNGLLIGLGEQSAESEASTLAARAAAARPIGPLVQRTKTVLRAKALPANFAAAASVKTVALAAKNTKSPQGPELPVLMLSMKGDDLFEAGSATLRKEAEAGLREVAAVLFCRAHAPVLIRGCADGATAPETNAGLSRRRAEVIRRWLLATGCVGEKNVSMADSAAGDTSAPKKKSKRAEAPAEEGRERRVTFIIPEVTEGTFSSASL